MNRKEAASILRQVFKDRTLPLEEVKRFLGMSSFQDHAKDVMLKIDDVFASEVIDVEVREVKAPSKKSTPKKRRLQPVNQRERAAIKRLFVLHHLSRCKKAKSKDEIISSWNKASFGGKAYSVSPNSWYSTLYQLRDEGLIRKVGSKQNGGWKITAAGKRELKEEKDIAKAAFG